MKAKMWKNYLFVCRRRDINEKLVNQWINEEFEWCRSNSSTDSYNAGKCVMDFRHML